MIRLLSLASANTGFLGLAFLAGRPWWFLPLIIGSVLLILGGIGAGLWWYFVYRKRKQGIVQVARGIESDRLLSTWERFLKHLPRAAAVAISSRDHFLVLGAAGSGKSTLIQRKVDWQGQASQFLPSFTADPLLQIYLGSQCVVHELSGPLLESTSAATNKALSRWFGKLDTDGIPTVVLALKVSALNAATPDQVRQLAQLMRGKINLLAENFRAPIPTRICLTNVDRTHGYSDLARFLKRIKTPLELPIGADADLITSLQAYDKHVPRALTTLPIEPFQSSVEFLLAAEDVLGPVRSFVQAFLQDSLTAARPELQKLYFFSPPPDEQIGNPFSAPASSSKPRKIFWWRRWLSQLGLKPLHAALAAAVIIAGLSLLGIVTRRHAALVHAAEHATQDFTSAVHRAEEAHTIPSESAAVRRSEQEASRTLSAVHEAEARFRPLRLLFHGDKAATQQHFVRAIRDGYLLPELHRAVRQRARDRILYALVAIYATRHNSLGSFVRAQPEDFSREIGVNSDILLDYVRASEQPYRDAALRLLPPLPSESPRFPVNELKPWREFVRTILSALPLPYISMSQLKALQGEAERLLEALAQVRKARLLRQLFLALKEESPLDMVPLFGSDAGVLIPEPWIVDHAEPIEKLLTLVRDSSLQLSGGGRMSLLRLLKWINELSAATGVASPNPAEEAKKFDEELYYLPFPDEPPSEVSRRAWLELLLRSRKRLLLAVKVRSATSYRSHARLDDDSRQSSRCEPPKRRRHYRSRSCAPAEPDRDSSQDSGTCCQRSRHRHRHRNELPLWNREEVAPKLAAIAQSDDTSDDGIDDLYSRELLEKEVLPLVQELKRALAANKSLNPEEKARLLRVVRSQVGGYADQYCAALRRYYLSYRFHGSSNASIHTELINLIKPGSPFLSRLRTIADNVNLSGLEDPYLRPLAQCLAEFQPIAALLNRDSAGAPPQARNSDAKAAAPGHGASQGQALNQGPAKDSAPPSAWTFPEGLQAYKDAVNRLLGDLDNGTTTGGNVDKTSPLSERLSPLGRGALAALDGRDTPLRMVEKFLDEAGIVGALRGPFLAPFRAASRNGLEELKRVLAQHWRDELLPQVAPLFSRFPFNRSGDREVSPTELEALSEAKGPFWQAVKTFYAPVLVERNGTYQVKPLPSGSIELPSDLLPTLNRLAHLSRALFATDGSRHPLRLTIRGLPGRSVQPDRSTQGTTSFLQVGRSAVYDFNQQPSALPFTIDWWDQGVAMVGIESTTSRTGRRQTQSLEVADSAWSLFRLLQKSTLESDGTSTWRLLGNGSGESQFLRFVIQPDPWAMFQVHLP